MVEINTGHNRCVCFEFVLHVIRNNYIFTYKFICLPNYRGDDRTEIKIYSRCIPLAVVLRIYVSCTVHLLNVVERMHLDVAQFLHI